jgi:NADPH2:quinone reductase
MEGAGEVVACGEGADEFKVGQRVAWCLAWGSYAQYAVVPSHRLCEVPEGLPLDVAATTIFPGCTAHYLVHDVARLEPGQRCLVHAASGVIGQMLVQMARAIGAEVYATTSTPERAQVALACGAHAVFSYADVESGVKEITHGEGVHVVWDAIGRDTLRTSFRVTRKRGLVVNYGAVSGPLNDLDPLELGEAGSLFLTRPRLADHIADAATLSRRATEVFDALAKGTLKFQIAQRYTLETVGQAHAALEERRAMGKSVLDLPLD